MLTSKPGQDDLQVLRELVEAAKLTPLIGRTYPLGDVPEAMRALEAGNTRGKIVITVYADHTATAGCSVACVRLRAS